MGRRASNQHVPWMTSSVAGLMERDESLRLDVPWGDFLCCRLDIWALELHISTTYRVISFVTGLKDGENSSQMQEQKA